MKFKKMLIAVRRRKILFDSQGEDERPFLLRKSRGIHERLENIANYVKFFAN
jgi:hypothetical protein